MPNLFTGLLISTRRNTEQNASSEIHYTLTKELEISPTDIKAKNSGISGLITVMLKNVDILDVMDRLIALEKDETYFVYCLKIRPVLHRIPMEFEKLEELIEVEKNKIIGKFKIEVNKRHVNIRTAEIIKVIASNIENQVDLDNPDTLILVEIIGDKLGLSIISPEYIFSTKKAAAETESSEDNWFL